MIAILVCLEFTEPGICTGTAGMTWTSAGPTLAAPGGGTQAVKSWNRWYWRIYFPNASSWAGTAGLWWDCHPEFLQVTSPDRLCPQQLSVQRTWQMLHALSWPGFGSHRVPFPKQSKVRAVTSLIRLKWWRHMSPLQWEQCQLKYLNL